jgi:hypothetical protein
MSLLAAETGPNKYYESAGQKFLVDKGYGRGDLVCFSLKKVIL